MDWKGCLGSAATDEFEWVGSVSVSLGGWWPLTAEGVEWVGTRAHLTGVSSG